MRDGAIGARVVLIAPMARPDARASPNLVVRLASPRRARPSPNSAQVSLVTVAARKDGGLIVRDVEYTPVGAGVTVLERVNLRLPPRV